MSRLIESLTAVAVQLVSKKKGGKGGWGSMRASF